MTYFAGIDVSLRSVNICVVDDDGERVAEAKLSSDVQEIVAYLDELEYSIDLVGLEAPRFKRSRTVAAHFGLTPRRSQSGEFDFDGRISKAGDAEVRRTLYVAANSVLTRSSRWSSLRAWGMKLKKNRGHKKAVVAVARKLAVILHRLWIDETQFQWGMERVRS